MHWRRAFARARIVALVFLMLAPTAVPAQSVLSPEFARTNAPYSPEERAGREIWMFATAFNDRFFTYTYPQRLGAAVDWHRILGADRRGDLFESWGAIPNPDCCVPGAAAAPRSPPKRPTASPGAPATRTF